MGNNIAELKARLASLNRKTSKNTDIWKPKDEHDVRILPIDGEFFQEKAFHFNIGDAREVLCPKVNFGDECVICDYAETLKGWKDDKGRDKPEKLRKEQWDLFKKIQATAKAYLPIVERTDEGKSISAPAWWGLTQNQANQVLEVISVGTNVDAADNLRECGIDPDDSDHALDALTSPKKAYDLHVSFRKPGEKENKKTFTVVDIKARKRPTPLTGNVDKDAELVKEVKPLSEVFIKVPSSEVEKIFAKFMGGAAKEPKADGGKEYAPKGKDKAEGAGTRKVEEAFDELLNSSK